MSDSISPREFREAEGTEDWRIVGDGARAYFTTGSFLAGAAFAAYFDEFDRSFRAKVNASYGAK